LWGLRQQIFGTDAAEDHWLWVEDHQDEHILFGVLRVFSFYSDAGQFGSSQAMMSLLCGIIALGPGSLKTRLWYGFAALMTFIGFAISGTRGALAIPAAGGILYLIMTKNFKILIIGLVVGGTIFGVLKYTTAFHGVEQVRRMRTALDPDNPSLQSRFRNQQTYRKYLSSRPIGAGVGTAGYWGNRFSPGTIPAETPTDSWYVKIWAETGIIGLCFHVFWIGYFLGKGGNITWNLRNQQLRAKIMGIYSAVGGVVIASYGNQILGQMPTGIIICIALPVIWLAPLYDEELMKKEEAEARVLAQQQALRRALFANKETISAPNHPENLTHEA
jgi:O-antigen ligase